MGNDQTQDGVDQIKKIKVVLGFPWYGGPDIDCFPLFFEIMHYFGRLRERSIWYNALRQLNIDAETSIPPLDMISEEPGLGELDPGEIDGIFEFFIAVETRMSLPGLARERVVDMAMSANADWLLFWDSDMRFQPNAFLRLWRHNKPVVAALAFTSRDPIQPVIYKIKEGYDPVNKCPTYDSMTVFDYPENKLITDQDIDGSLAFGAGVVLINMNVFRQIPKPWFNSTGCGEDWFFAVQCHRNGISRYVDTSVKALHKKHSAQWYDEEVYKKAREREPELYEKMMNRELIPV